MTKDEDGMFICPCGHHAPAKWNVKRHMESCKVVKAAARNVDKAAVAELKASLEAIAALFERLFELHSSPRHRPTALAVHQPDHKQPLDRMLAYFGNLN